MSSRVLDFEKYTAKARQAVAEGQVLLLNQNHVLPLPKGSHVAVFGRMQLHYYKSGTGSDVYKRQAFLFSSGETTRNGTSSIAIS